MENDLADYAYSKKVMSLLLSSCAQQPADPKVFLDQLTVLGVGKSKELLKKLVHPTDGILAKTKFIPSIAEVGDWLGIPQDKAHQARMQSYERLNQRFIEAPINDSEESKAAALARWDAINPKKKRGIERIFEPDGVKPIQVEDRAALRRALANLEAMNRWGDEDGQPPQDR